MTHQPALWKGESSQVVIVSRRTGTIQSNFAQRMMRSSYDDKLTTPSYHRVCMDAIEASSIVTE
jgi:hypothetical protein